MTEPTGLGAVAANVIAVGKEVEALRRMHESHRTRLGRLELDIRLRADAQDQLGQQLEALATTVAGLGQAIADLVDDEDPDSAGAWSWFDAEDRIEAADLLEQLSGWLDGVYLRYPDSSLPPCWLWHPDVVEEVLWLWRSWKESFRGKSAAPFRMADWHDRYRPGVSKRIEANHGTCSLREHLAPDGKLYTRQERRVGLTETQVDIAEWWTGLRGQAPSPTPDDVREAEAQ